MEIKSNIGIQCVMTFLIVLFYYGVIEMYTKFKTAKTDAI